MLHNFDFYIGIVILSNNGIFWQFNETMIIWALLDSLSFLSISETQYNAACSASETSQNIEILHAL